MIQLLCLGFGGGALGCGIRGFVRGEFQVSKSKRLCGTTAYIASAAYCALGVGALVFGLLILPTL